MLSGTSQTNLIGAAGEYFVAAELSKAGWLATVTIKNAPGVDVLGIGPPPDRRAVAIQVKTTTKSSFVLPNPVPEAEQRRDDFFVLVRIRTGRERPDFYVIPARLAHRVPAWHRAQFEKRNGRPASTNTVSPGWIAGFREAWQLLEDDSAAEALLDAKYPRFELRG